MLKQNVWKWAAVAMLAIATAPILAAAHAAAEAAPTATGATADAPTRRSIVSLTAHKSAIKTATERLKAKSALSLKHRTLNLLTKKQLKLAALKRHAKLLASPKAGALFKSRLGLKTQKMLKTGLKSHAGLKLKSSLKLHSGLKLHTALKLHKSLNLHAAAIKQHKSLKTVSDAGTATM
jgi:hypothetical protein